MSFQHYFYNEQFRSYLLQFVNLFTGLRVKTGKRSTGESTFINVPVRYASMSRMTNMLSKAHGNPDPEEIDQINVSLPVMSAWLISVLPRDQGRRGAGIIDRRTYLTIQDVGESADVAEQASKIRVTARPIPVPYMMEIGLTLWASNTDQHLQMLEQILMVFNPDLIIQKNDSQWDWTALTTVKMLDVGIDTEVPIGTEEEMITSTLTFEIPVFLAGPRIEIKGNGHVDAVRANIRDGSEYSGSLDELALDGQISDGITNTGTIIDVLGDPIDNNIDEDGNSSGTDIT